MAPVNCNMTPPRNSGAPARVKSGPVRGLDSRTLLKIRTCAVFTFESWANLISYLIYFLLSLCAYKLHLQNIFILRTHHEPDLLSNAESYDLNSNTGSFRSSNHLYPNSFQSQHILCILSGTNSNTYPTSYPL